MSVKYASTSSSRFGLPYAMSSTALCSAAMHERREPLEMLDRGVRQDAVPEIENMSRSAAGGFHHASGAVLDNRPRAKQERRIEVALDAPVVAHHPPGVAKIHPPVDADAVTPRVFAQGQHPGGAGREV